jgi:hypothetical protein
MAKLTKRQKAIAAAIEANAVEATSVTSATICFLPSIRRAIVKPPNGDLCTYAKYTPNSQVHH